MRQENETHELHRALDALLAPLTWVHRRVLARIHLSQQTSHMVLGLVVMVTGSTIAASAPHDPFVAHIIVDVVGYYMHGLGAAPLVKWVLELCGIEGA